jgi:hypothetical protein
MAASSQLQSVGESNQYLRMTSTASSNVTGRMIKLKSFPINTLKLAMAVSIFFNMMSVSGRLKPFQNPLRPEVPAVADALLSTAALLIICKSPKGGLSDLF